MTAQDKKPRLRYCVILMIKHPNINPTNITAKLKIKPWNSWVAGAARTTIVGSPLPGINQCSFWTAHKNIKGNRLFFRDVLKLIEKLESLKEYIINITDTGGDVFITVQLPGDINIGDNLDWTLSKRLAALKIGIGFEVFPEFK